MKTNEDPHPPGKADEHRERWDLDAILTRIGGLLFDLDVFDLSANPAWPATPEAHAEARARAHELRNAADMLVAVLGGPSPAMSGSLPPAAIPSTQDPHFDTDHVNGVEAGWMLHLVDFAATTDIDGERHSVFGNIAFAMRLRQVLTDWLVQQDAIEGVRPAIIIRAWTVHAATQPCLRIAFTGLDPERFHIDADPTITAAIKWALALPIDMADELGALKHRKNRP